MLVFSTIRNSIYCYLNTVICISFNNRLLNVTEFKGFSFRFDLIIHCKIFEFICRIIPIKPKSQTMWQTDAIYKSPLFPYYDFCIFKWLSCSYWSIQIECLSRRQPEVETEAAFVSVIAVLVVLIPRPDLHHQQLYFKQFIPPSLYLAVRLCIPLLLSVSLPVRLFMLTVHMLLLRLTFEHVCLFRRLLDDNIWCCCCRWWSWFLP